MNNKPQQSTHFGYKSVPEDEKVHRVKEVFNSVASKYDVMNDLMSLGLHRHWKKFAITLADIRPNQRILDLATGTADIAAGMAEKLQPTGQLIASDINNSMLSLGRENLINKGYINNIHTTQANAEALPFPDNYFDRITISFGLRNVTHKETALAEMCRTLKPGGMLLVLEFSTPPSKALSSIYDSYSFNVLPKLGEAITQDAESYRYLAESIRMHPDQETLKSMIIKAGFDQCEHHNLCAGIVALHKAVKY